MQRSLSNEKDTRTRGQIQDEVVKDIHPLILLSTMSKYQVKLASLVWQPVEEKENCEFKPVEFHLFMYSYIF